MTDQNFPIWEDTGLIQISNESACCVVSYSSDITKMYIIIIIIFIIIIIYLTTDQIDLRSLSWEWVTYTIVYVTDRQVFYQKRANMCGRNLKCESLARITLALGLDETCRGDGVA